MPRVNLGKPPELLRIQRELRSRHGGMMTAAAVGRELGIKKQASYNAWLADVPWNDVNGRRKYPTDDVAEKIYRTREVPA